MATKLPEARSHGGGTSPDPHLGRVATGGALAVMALGLAVMVGWLLGIEPLKQVLPGLSSMKFNTALGFLLAGGALYFREKPGLRHGLAGAVGLLGALTLAQVFTGVDSGIDQLFVREAAVAGQAPGRMSPATALCFLLSGAALGLLGRRTAEALAISVWAVGFIALLGYSFGAPNLYSIPGFVSVALHTAAGFAVLAAGFLCAVPGGIVSLLLRTRGTGRLLWLGFGVLAALLIVLGVITANGLQSIRAEVNAQANVAQPRSVAARELEVNVLDYGLGVRVFLAGDAAARERTNAAARDVAAYLAEYERLVETPRQWELAAHFTGQWHSFQTLGEALMAAGTVAPEDLARLAALRLALQAFLDDEMQPESVTAYDAHQASTQETLRHTEGLTLLLLVGGVVLALVTSGGVVRAVIGGEEALRKSHEQYRNLFDSIDEGFCVIELLFDERGHPADFRYLEINPAFEKLTGLQDARGKTIRELAPEIESSWIELYGNVVASGEPVRIVDEAKPLNRWFEVYAFRMGAPGSSLVGVLFSNISDRKRSEEELRLSEALHLASEQRTRLATEATGVGIWEWNVLTTQIRWNATMFSIFGVTPTPDGMVPYEAWRGAVLPEDLAEQEAVLQDTVRRRGRNTRAFRIRRANDGECRHLEGVEIVRMNAQGDVEWVVGTNLDVTARKQAEASLIESAELRSRTRLLAEQNAEVELARHTLEEKAAELALTSKYKSEFLANMSHELRTPLNSILIFSQQLAENKAGNLTGKQVEYSGHIHSSGTDLLHLISDILDLSKIESGTVSIDIGEISIASLRDNIDRNFRHVAEAKNLPFHFHLAESLPPTIDSDLKRLQQILKNLLSNAVKFTSSGQVEVRVAIASHGWSPEHPVLSKAPQVISFAVEDTGIGIAPEKQRLIFEAFQQADAGTSRNYGGTGLGLAISRELAVLLGGEITLASVPGEGSTFTLYLPVHHSGPAAVLPASSHIPPATREIGVPPHALQYPHHPALHGRKVLVVDDDARNIFALVALLENHQMEVLTATSGHRALEIIQSTPDLSLVLMDIMMPEMDGYETIRAIRKAPESRTLPILALTAKAMKGDREKCLEAGASDYIAKPVDTAQLLSLMQWWLTR